MLPNYELPTDGMPFDDFYSNTSVTLGELADMGFWPSNGDYTGWEWDKYDEEQYVRLMSMILEHYYWRELGVMPAYRWRRTFLRRMNEIMPKYKPLYDREKAGVNPLQIEDTYDKGRTIFSDFPATQLTGNADYTSTGTDNESEQVKEGSYTELSNLYAERARTVDVMIIEELDDLFSCLLTSTTELW